MSSARAALMLAPLLLPACLMPELPEDGDSYYTTPGDRDGGGDSARPPPTAPVLQALPSSYAFESVPIRGSSQPSVTILAQSSTGQTASAPSNGNFCLDLALTINATQTVTVRAQSNVDGQFSPAASFTITQDGTTDPPPPPPPEPENQARDKPAVANHTPYTGSLGLLTDGDLNPLQGQTAYWELWSGDVVVSVDLGQIFDLTQIKILFGLQYPTAYTVYSSTAATVGLDLGAEEWSTAAYADSGVGIGGDGGWDSWYYGPTRQARHVAFSFPNPLFGTLYLDIAEIEAWARDLVPDGSTDPVKPTCANGLLP